MMTRADYLNALTEFHRANPNATKFERDTVMYAAHRRFYAAVIATAGIDPAAWAKSEQLTVAQSLTALANGDEHLNTIPLPRWDQCAAGMRRAISTALKKHGDFWSSAGGVCFAKELARLAVAAQDSHMNPRKESTHER